MSQGRLIILSGPSGAGKTTVGERLLEHPRVRRVVTATTRSPRPGEVDGRDYHFLDRQRFERGIEAGEFLEHATVHGNLYGTPRGAVTELLEAGHLVLLTIDVQGARQIRERAAELRPLSIFLVAPDEDELERRLRSRQSEGEEEIRNRLETARGELREKDGYDHIVVNEDVERAARDILALADCENSPDPESCQA